jgi:hypothetical protein
MNIARRGGLLKELIPKYGNDGRVLEKPFSVCLQLHPLVRRLS